MLYPVPIGDCTLDWRLRDGSSLLALLRARPWENAGGIYTCLLCSADHAEHFQDQLRKAIRGEVDGAQELSFRLVEEAQLEAGLRAGLAEELGLPATVPEARLVEALKGEARRMLSFVTLRAPLQEYAGLFAQAQELRDALRKQEPSVPLNVFFLLDRRPDQWPSGQTSIFDLRTGAPVEWLLERSRTLELDALWPRYVHHRIAWESGGRPDRAERWGACQPLLSLKRPNDERLEEILNALASKEWEGLRPETQQQALALLDRLTGARVAPSLLGQADLLFQEAMLTGPEGAEELLFAPWVARALLLQEPTRRGYAWLRQALVCLPIVQECLARCFTLEALVRARLPIVPDGTVFSEDTQKRLQFFTRADKSWERKLLPDHHPAPPSTQVDFASLGELLSLHQLDRRRDALYFELLDLRNVLAHGHYASWATLSVLQRVEKGLRWQG